MRNSTFSGKRRVESHPANRKTRIKRVLLLALAAVMLLPTAAIATDEKITATTDKEYASTNFKEGSYSAYSSKYSGVSDYSGDFIIIKGTDYVDTNQSLRTYPLGFEGVKDAVYTKDQTSEGELNDTKELGNQGEIELIESTEAYITYKVTVPETALYECYIKYYPVEGKQAAIERALYIDDEMPFDEAGYMSFSRVWQDTEAVGSKYDSAGNEIRPDVEESPEWRTEYCNDDAGYYFDPFKFYLEAGEHEIKIASIKEPMVIAEIGFGISEKPASYAEVQAEYAANGYTASSNQSIKIEAESTYKKSDSSLYPYHSRASVYNSSINGSFSYDHTQVNVIGGERWEQAGQWITWQITVEESGLYNISMRARQNVNKGMSSGRCLYINGEIPFAEAENCSFEYQADFEIYTLGNAEIGEPFQFYFEAGKTYEITLKANLGGVEALARRLDASVNALMSVYRRMLMLIGNDPDTERDYNFDKYMPNELITMSEQANELRSISDDMYALTGQKNSDQAMLERAADRLDKMVNRPILIAENFTGFKSDVSAISNWILDLNYQPLEVDYLVISSPDKKLPKANAGFFSGIAHELKLFVSSFTTDYTGVGALLDSEDAITVWFAPGAAGQVVGGGREQAQILKSMIEDDFIVKTDIPVNLQIIDMSALLPATLAGKGPDVALQVSSTLPVQYAMRGAVAPLTQFDDFEEIAKRFYSSSLVQFTYTNDVYALPETQNFQVMFYRTDILDELGIEVPDTWADVYDIIPELQNSYMNFGYPANVNNFITLIYQRGGTLYKGEGDMLGYASNLDSPIAIDAFIDYVDLYRSYRIDLKIDFQNRFRTGEVPIGIADFTTVNQLSVTAPEIRGLWSFALMPGTERTNEDGTTYVDRSSATTGNGSIILQKSEKKEAAWEFLKWWTSDSSQTRYCLEVESIIGEAARIPSANISVMYNQAWTIEQYTIIQAQRSWTKGIPEVPGGYYTSRHMDNAFNRTYSLMTDPRETLLDYIDDINDELTKKRNEMGLQTIDDILASEN